MAIARNLKTTALQRVRRAVFEIEIAAIYETSLMYILKNKDSKAAKELIGSLGTIAVKNKRSFKMLSTEEES